MRAAIFSALFVVAACGHHNGNGDDAATDGAGDDSAIDGAPADAFVPVACTPVSGTPALTTQNVATGLDMPVFATAPKNDPRLFILEKGTGQIKILKDGQVLATPFLTISVANSEGDLQDERGLLGLAFPDDYSSSGIFYVYFVNTSSDEEIDRYHVSANADVADGNSAEEIWSNSDFASNHNGGTIAFGPDGYLYFGVGDGGNANDGMNYGQNTNVLFGKMNRIDVSTTPYSIPDDNPFAAGGGAGEIWDWGLRNPYRWSFDRQTGDLYIGDVGQNLHEEIDVEPAGTGDLNYGWRQMEAAECFNPSTGCNTTGKTLPVYEYDHGEGCAVVGGYVYRGACMPDYDGTYFFADYCGHFVRSFEWSGGTIGTVTEHDGLGAGGDPVAFAQDGYGELYIVRQDTGVVQKIVPQ